MKLANSEQIRGLDQSTIEGEPIASIDLMERASAKCFQWLKSRYDARRPVCVLAGNGNNGGDGLAIARMLASEQRAVKVLLMNASEKRSADNATNLQRLNELNVTIEVLSEETLDQVESHTVVVDALFGSGLDRPIEGRLADLVYRLNRLHLEVVSIDSPSGLFSDQATPPGSAIIKASHTLVFELPRLSLFMAGCAPYLGDFHMLSIGLDREAIAKLESDQFYLDSIAEYSPHFKRATHGYKGDYGHALMAAGSFGKMGAAVLCGSACLRAGVGLLTMHVPGCGINIMQTALPEAMVDVDKDLRILTLVNASTDYEAIGIGPGIGIDPKTIKSLLRLLQNPNRAYVIDADALNILALQDNPMDLIPPNAILTPHIGEFKRLFGDSENDFERIKTLRSVAREASCYILLKGAYSALATPTGELYFNSTGNPGMGTAGSGDVLTGIITGLLAQTQEPFVAALCGMYLHGTAGDLAAQEKGHLGLIGSDIVEHLPQAIKKAFSF